MQMKNYFISNSSGYKQVVGQFMTWHHWSQKLGTNIENEVFALFVEQSENFSWKFERCIAIAVLKNVESNIHGFLKEKFQRSLLIFL